MKPMRFLIATALSSLVLLSCGESDKDIQEGERIAVEDFKGGSPDASQSAVPSLTLPSMVSRSWPQHLGGATHLGINAQFSGAPNLVSVLGDDQAPELLSIRSPFGNANDLPGAFGTSAPILVGGIIYQYKSSGDLVAFRVSGEKLWSVSLVPAGQSKGDGIGGGLALASGTLYVTPGYGEVVAVNPQSGARKWTYVQKAPIHKAPLVEDGMVVAISEGANAVGLNAATGQVVWRHFANPTTLPTRFNAGVPAAANGKVVLVYASGAAAVLNLQSGEVIWEKETITDAISGAKSVFSDVTGDPVIDGSSVIMGTGSGIISLDLDTGFVNWQRNIGTKGPLIVAGNAILGISPSNQVFRLSRNDGSVAFRASLPRYKNETLKTGRIGYGDVRLAANAIWTINSKGQLLKIDPNQGNVIQTFEIKHPFAHTPIVAEGYMFGVSEKGQVAVYR